MAFARTLRLLLAVALLAAWQGALVHPIEHVDHAGELVHLDGTGHDEERSLDCDALAAVGACVANGLTPVAVCSSEIRNSNEKKTAAPASPGYPGYRSQAPPQYS